jgi:primosomal protein N' (replication factor Y)
MKKRKLLREALADFREGRTHLLLGTQMVAKGLNFPGVKLVGIVNADTGFQMPDFRAAERTFDLLVQVSGRAGRTLPDGKVLIQTMRPDNPAIVMAREGRLADFYSAELDTRRQLAFPPYSRLIRLVERGRCRRDTRPCRVPDRADLGQLPLAPARAHDAVLAGARARECGPGRLQGALGGARGGRRGPAGPPVSGTGLAPLAEFATIESRRYRRARPC